MTPLQKISTTVFLPASLLFASGAWAAPEDFGVRSCVLDQPVAAANALPVFTEEPTLSRDELVDPLFTIDSQQTFEDAVDRLLFEAVEASTGRVAYDELTSGELSESFRKIFTFLSTETPELNTEDEKIAYWVNAYNLVMIERLIGDRNAISNVLRRAATFSRNTSPVAGVEMTLDDIEYGILKMANRNASLPEGLDPSLAPDVKEPRLHVALVCGAESCPKLRNRTYTADVLDRMLQENLLLFFNNEEKHISTNDAGALRVSALFSWFSGDFQLIADTFPRFADFPATYVSETCRADKQSIVNGFDDAGGTRRLRTLSYDWTVNDIDNSF